VPCTAAGSSPLDYLCALRYFTEILGTFENFMTLEELEERGTHLKIATGKI